MDNSTITQSANEVVKYDITFGVIIGIIVSVIGYAIIEYFKTRTLKKNIRSLIKIELKNYSRFLQELYAFVSSSIISVPAGHLMITRIHQMLPDNGKFKPSYYMSLKPETKATAFNEMELAEMEPLYTRIHHFHSQAFAIGNVSFSGFSFSGDVVNNLVIDIAKIVEKLE